MTLGYVLVSAALTLLVPYYEINPSAALPEAFSHVGMHWVKYVVSLGAICGMTTTLFGSLFSLPRYLEKLLLGTDLLTYLYVSFSFRCMYAMAVDGLLFSFLGNVNTQTQLPLTNLMISGVFSATIALLFDLEKLVEFMSIGTLLAYTIVSASVIILRYRPTYEAKVASTPASEVSASTTSGMTTPTSEMVTVVGTLKPHYNWLYPLFGRCEPGSVVTGAVFVFTVFTCALCVLMQVTTVDLKNWTWWTASLAFFFVSVMAASK